jgi:hypothetical protein
MDVNGRYANPSFHHFPKALGVAAMGKKLDRRFLRLVAKRATSTIGSIPSRKTVRRPNPIMESQPSEELKKEALKRRLGRCGQGGHH